MGRKGLWLPVILLIALLVPSSVMAGRGQSWCDRHVGNPNCGPTPTASPTPSPTAVPTPSPTPVPSPTATPTPTPATGGAYGPATAGDTLANTQVGGVNAGGYNTRLSHRFVAGASSTLTAVQFYVIANGNTGYSGGTGGTIEVTVQTNDPATNAPTGTVLARATYASGNPTPNRLPKVTFSTPPTLSAGSLYHVVFRNIDPSPTANFLSVNALYTWHPVTPRQPKYTDLQWGQMVDQGSGWRQRPGYTAIMGLSYGNGSGDGIGYMGAWQQVQPAISGPNLVRNRFTVSGPSRSIQSVSVRLKRDDQTTGTSPVTVRLEDGAGNLIDSGAIPASTFPLGRMVDAPQNVNEWGTVTFASPRTLASGSTYAIVLTAPSDTVFRAEALQKGSGYGFPVGSYFRDGYAQRSSDGGATWYGFDQPGGSANRTDGDWQWVAQ